MTNDNATEDKPNFTADDLALLDGHAPRESDDSVVDECRDRLAAGHFSLDELTRLHNLSPDEVAAIQQPRLEPASIEDELASIKKLRTEDPKRYWSDEVQKRELALVEQQVASKAGKAPDPQRAPVVTAAVAPAATSLEAVETELAEISKQRRADSQAYWKNERLQQREAALIEQQIALKAAETQAGHVQAVAESVLADLDEDDRPVLEESFGKLPDSAVAAVQAHLGSPFDATAIKPASDADLERFASTEEGKELVGEWRIHAPRKLAILRERLDAMITSASPADMEAASKWFDDLPPKQAKAIMKALAG